MPPRINRVSTPISGRASVKAGSTRCCQVSAPALGRSWSWRAKIRMNMIPSQKLGTDWPSSEMIETNPSTHEPGRRAAAMPSGKLIAIARIIAVIASRAVAANRSPTASVAGWSSRSELPKSRRIAWARKRPY